MKTKEVLEGLERECEQCGVKLIYDELQTEGGSCRLRDSYYIIINRRASAETRIRMIREALADIRRKGSEAVSSEAVRSEAGSSETVRQFPGA